MNYPFKGHSEDLFKHTHTVSMEDRSSFFAFCLLSSSSSSVLYSSMVSPLEKWIMRRGVFSFLSRSPSSTHSYSFSFPELCPQSHTHHRSSILGISWLCTILWGFKLKWGKKITLMPLQKEMNNSSLKNTTVLLCLLYLF